MKRTTQDYKRSQLDRVKRYIANQKEHHKKRNFEEEFIALVKAHNVDYDPICFWLSKLQ